MGPPGGKFSPTHAVALITGARFLFCKIIYSRSIPNNSQVALTHIVVLPTEARSLPYDLEFIV